MISIIKRFEKAIKENWNQLALTDFEGVSFRYGDIARKVEKLHIMFEYAGIKPGDKIAVCGKNSAQWSVAFLASMTYGAVAVPLLQDFKAENLQQLVNHSDAKLLFVDESVWENLDAAVMDKLMGAVNINGFSLFLCRDKKLDYARAHLNELFGKKYPERFSENDVKYEDRDPESLAAINYTSGSTGFSKGVMIPLRAFSSNVQYCIDHLECLHAGDSAVAMLPLAHMYGLTIDLLHAFSRGCHLYFLTRMPSPRGIINAFANAHPPMIVTVPLIIEKIIKKNVFPLLDKPVMKLLLKVPYVDQKLLARIKNKLTETFGGRLQELIVGGAAINGDVERFLSKIEFPLTNGYGMTECAPLISYAPPAVNKVGSCGRIVDRMEGRIDSPDPENVPGELWVRGTNLMLGYYKNEAATQAVMKDGWMNTGDLATMDSEGFLFLRGRSKNMILGSNGQNIYPEEIEQQVNNLPFVNESLVIEESGKLKALIYPDFESAEQENLSHDELQHTLEESIKQLNTSLPSYSQIAGIQMYNEEFEKTPKRSIKRYLYQH